jgi:histidinol-phosphate/aromatic aminotransferase/cobyric acid decarboxylase-like protein
MKNLHLRLQNIAYKTKFNMEIFPSSANFVLIRLQCAPALMDYLHQRGISLRAIGNDMIRISAGDEKTLDMVLDEMEMFLMGDA